MEITTFSEFRNNAKKYFDDVEKGETVQIYRHGKPAAILIPAVSSGAKRFSKKIALNISGVSLSRTLISEREETK